MKAPFLTCIFGLALCAMAAADETATVRLTYRQTSQPIGIEPQGGAFHSVIEAEGENGSYTIARLSGETVAVFATTGPGMHSEIPIGRFRIAGTRASRVRLTLTRSGNQLTVAAADAGNHQRALAVTPVSHGESMQASLEAPKTGKPAAIAAGPTVKTTLSVRSASGTLRPFVHAGDPAGSSATINLAPVVPGQTNADITVYAGENRYVENNHPYARYLIDGLSEKKNARFLITFKIGPKGEMELPEAVDSVTKQPLQVSKYSSRLAKNFSAPAPVAEGPAGTAEKTSFWAGVWNPSGVNKAQF